MAGRAAASNTPATNETASDKPAAETPEQQDLNIPAGTAGPLESDANPTGAANQSTGPVGTPEVIEGAEHVLGDDPRRVVNQAGYHDSISGRPVTEDGRYTDVVGAVDDRIPEHRIVANNWPQLRDRGNDPAKREGNEAADNA